MNLTKMLTTSNVGTTDRILRILPAALVGITWAYGWIAGWTAIFLAMVAAILLLTKPPRVVQYLPRGWLLNLSGQRRAASEGLTSSGPA